MLTVKDPTTDFQLPPHNEAALEGLREAKNVDSTVALAANDSTIATSTIAPAGWLLFGLAYKPLVRVEKIARLENLTTVLLEEFKSEGIQVFPALQIEDQNPIDLFIRFPRKTHLFISIRSQGHREIVYNEAREALQVKRKDKNALKIWKPCPLVELADYEKWLNKNRDLFGMSSREAQKTPTAKVLVLWPPTKAIGNHKEHLYSEVGNMKILAFRRKGTAFVIEKEEVIEFIKAWLARYKKD
ncbi:MULTISPECIES: hypothetical protein [unclassified Dolichospermum]|jgi:hypothetical protein|uniref:hypothetical protein n=1 Tax=unclassified Dolichospermum TaxID=2622029 RepID=UPI001446694B|nr:MULTISPECIES: hypothetical protein [unclassified Dolichospermum]MTJ15768.1 hypothetical protein [Dolichospermum sp. UHCC 0299]MTJ39304.1 hypothetical protein [Dolichospermum sp. UHCC 0406]MTJ47620.1 hypothetical protein [Dolichospermum sp. UHCC 0259]